MKLKFFFILFYFMTPFLRAQTDYDSYPVYGGNDLGLKYSPTQSSFRIWAPSATQAELVLYNVGIGGRPIQVINMKKSDGGTWVATINGNQKGKFYAFRVKVKNAWLNEVPDPYAKSVGLNGKRAMVINLKETDPPGWEKDKSPPFGSPGTGPGEPVDAIVYELHIRDASIHENSGIKRKGKFIGLTEKGTKNGFGVSTGLDHLKELGVTHIHLLPCYDFYSVDENQPGKPQYNWGYDPLNYNVPEGSYATNAKNGISRIREFKQLIKTFHQNGLRVVMDVVYNHTMLTEDSYFNQLVPGYYYRQKADGSFSDATACGNETASERAMMRKFILESVKYWVNEFHIDGFRFDLMGVHDIETMNMVSKGLHEIKPDILLYGEGWTAGPCPLPDSARALKKNAHLLDRIAVFSDDLRDGIKGSVFDHTDRGFASGKPGMEESIKFGIVASLQHSQVNYSEVNYSKAPYAKAPYHTVSYCECHDNHVLWDKLSISVPGAPDSVKKQMYKLALSIVLTSQGISFLHAGAEFLRTKKGDENSYKSPDSINAIDWSMKSKHNDVFDYVQALIKMRKEHSSFRMKTAKQVEENIRFINEVPKGVVAYTINGERLNDSWTQTIIIFNGSGQTHEITLPQGKWKNYIRNNKVAKNGPIVQGKLSITASSCSILFLQQ
jgi:pullulanase